MSTSQTLYSVITLVIVGGCAVNNQDIGRGAPTSATTESDSVRVSDAVKLQFSEFESILNGLVSQTRRDCNELREHRLNVALGVMEATKEPELTYFKKCLMSATVMSEKGAGLVAQPELVPLRKKISAVVDASYSLASALLVQPSDPNLVNKLDKQVQDLEIEAKEEALATKLRLDL